MVVRKVFMFNILKIKSTLKYRRIRIGKIRKWSLLPTWARRWKQIRSPSTYPHRAGATRRAVVPTAKAIGVARNGGKQEAYRQQHLEWLWPYPLQFLDYLLLWTSTPPLSFSSTPSFFSCSSLPHWASLVAQRLKRLPAMRETWVRSLGREEGEGNGNPLK